MSGERFVTPLPEPGVTITDDSLRLDDAEQERLDVALDQIARARADAMRYSDRVVAFR